MGSKSYQTKVKLTIRADGRGFFGPGVAELMELIDACGSTKDACRKMDLSYTKGRFILKRAEEALGFPLIEIQHGGSGGGATRLTEDGRAYLDRFRELEAEVEGYAKQRFAEMFPGGNSF